MAEGVDSERLARARAFTASLMSRPHHVAPRAPRPAAYRAKPIEAPPPRPALPPLPVVERPVVHAVPRSEPERPRGVPGSARNVVLAAIVEAGEAGIDCQDLAVLLWSRDRERWGMSRHRGHCNYAFVRSRISDLGNRAWVELVGDGRVVATRKGVRQVHLLAKLPQAEEEVGDDE